MSVDHAFCLPKVLFWSSGLAGSGPLYHSIQLFKLHTAKIALYIYRFWTGNDTNCHIRGILHKTVRIWS